MLPGLPTLMIYGATGYSGTLIVLEALQHYSGAMSIIVAGRREGALRQMVVHRNNEWRVFALDEPSHVKSALHDVDIVLNAAGPFSATAAPLLDACLDLDIPYVDIGGEADVYEHLRFRVGSGPRTPAVVCSAAHSGALPDLMTAAAAQELELQGRLRTGGRVGVRACFSRVTTASRGSLETTRRMLERPVLVVRERVSRSPSGTLTRRSTLACEPVGRLERAFDFFATGQRSPISGQRVASAVSLVDTLVLRSSLATAGYVAIRIESYLEMSAWQRLGYGVGGWAALLSSLVEGARPSPFLGELFVDAPEEQDGRDEGHSVVVEIDSEDSDPLVRWQLDTPSPYQVTAQIALAVAAAVAHSSRSGLHGWVTPSQALRAKAGGDAVAALAGLRSCRLHCRP